MGLLGSLGLTFSKSKSKSTTKGTKDETTNATENETGLETTLGTQNNQSQSSSASSGNTFANEISGQKGTSASARSSLGSQESLNRDLTDKIQFGLGGLSDQIFNPSGGSLSLVKDEATKLNFRPEDFVAKAFQSAERGIGDQLEESLNGLYAGIGGTNKTNSGAALLANRLTGTAADQLAGIEASLTAQGQQIQQGNLGAISNALAQSGTGVLGDLVSAIKGGNVTTSGTETGSASEAIDKLAQSNTNVTEQSSEKSTQEQQIAQSVASAIEKLLQSNTLTKIDETTTGKNSSFGGSLKLGS